MGRLQRILRNGDVDSLHRVWRETEAAPAQRVLPAGEYVADVISSKLINSKSNNTPGIRFTFCVCDGEQSGQRFWLDLWLTANAMPATKRDLIKFGVNDLAALDESLPCDVRCRVDLVIRRDDEGNERNRVRDFEVVETTQPPRDPYAPPAFSDLSVDNVATNLPRKRRSKRGGRDV